MPKLNLEKNSGKLSIFIKSIETSKKSKERSQNLVVNKQLGSKNISTVEKKPIDNTGKVF